MWLIVKLTGSGVSVGLTAGLQFLPILLFGAWGGLLADRFPKRTLLTCTNLAMAVPAATLWLLTVHGSVQVWMVYALVLVRGSINALDNPARQSFVVEMVGGDRVVNAVALNSVIVHCSRIISVRPRPIEGILWHANCHGCVRPVFLTRSPCLPPQGCSASRHPGPSPSRGRHRRRRPPRPPTCSPLIQLPVLGPPGPPSRHRGTISPGRPFSSGR